MKKHEHHLQGRDYDRIMDETSARLERHTESLREAQEYLREAADDKPFLLVDATFDRAAKWLRKGSKELVAMNNGWSELLALYLQKLFCGEFPDSTLKIFQHYVGPDIQLVKHDVRNSTGLNSMETQEFSAAFFSGSAANVSYAFNEQLSRLRVRGSETDGYKVLNHADVYRRTALLYEQISELGIPVQAMCFGHQLIGREHGGEVGRAPDGSTAGLGMRNVEQTAYAGELFAGLGFTEKMEGVVPAYHDEAVTRPSHRSAVVLRSTDQDPGTVYGMIHAANFAFTGDAKLDAGMLKAHIEDGRHVALTTQYHPEFEGIMPFVEFQATGDFDSFDQNYEPQMAALMLKLFSAVIKMRQGA